MSASVSFMSHDATSHDWLLDRFVGRLSRHITVTHTQQIITPRRMAAQVLIHRHDRPVIGPVGACINFGCMIAVEP